MRRLLFALLGLSVAAGPVAAAPLLQDAWNDVGVVLEMGEFDGHHGFELLIPGSVSGRYELRDPFNGSVRYTFPNGYLYPAPQYLSYVGDLDGDPSDELVLYTGYPADPSQSRLGLFDVNGSFGPRWETTNTRGTYTDILSADLDGTGVRYILLRTGQTDFEIRRFADGTIVYQWTADGTPNEYVLDLQVVDFNQDGREELLLTTRPTSGAATRTHVLVLNAALSADGDPTFEDVSLAAQNAPNPFRGPTRIAFTLPARERVAVRVFDPAGRLVRTLVNETRAAGRHGVTWDGRDDGGRSVASGAYFYEVRAGGERLARKMLRVR